MNSTFVPLLLILAIALLLIFSIYVIWRLADLRHDMNHLKSVTAPHLFHEVWELRRQLEAAIAAKSETPESTRTAVSERGEASARQRSRPVRVSDMSSDLKLESPAPERRESQTARPVSATFKPPVLPSLNHESSDRPDCSSTGSRSS